MQPLKFGNKHKRFKCSVYGPFGKNQRAETITRHFDTEELRQEYIDKPKQLEVVGKVWEE